MASGSLGKCISAISKYLNYYINARVKKYNLNKNQVEILMTLYKNEGIPQYELGRQLMMDKITITKQLDNLHSQGYVIKKSGAKDGRVREVHITDKGWKIRSDLEQILTEVTEILALDLTDEQHTTVANILKQMSHNIYGELNRQEE